MVLDSIRRGEETDDDQDDDPQVHRLEPRRRAQVACRPIRTPAEPHRRDDDRRGYEHPDHDGQHQVDVPEPGELPRGVVGGDGKDGAGHPGVCGTQIAPPATVATAVKRRSVQRPRGQPSRGLPRSAVDQCSAGAITPRVEPPRAALAHGLWSACRNRPGPQ